MHEVQGRSSDRDLWLRPDLGSLGRRRGIEDQAELEALIAVGALGAEAVRFGVAQPGRHGDLVWTCGSYIKVASRRFIDVLERIDATGFLTFPIAATEPGVTDRYVGLAVVGGPDDDLRPVHDDGPFWSFFLSERAMRALRDAHVHGFEEVEDA